jgi:rubrerythrin
MVQQLSQEQLRDFYPSVDIKSAPGDQTFLKYAKQRELLANLDKHLDYRALQQTRHPYIKELKAAMQKGRATNPDYEDALTKADSILSKHVRFTTTQRDLNEKTLQASRMARQEKSTPLLKSERFRITTNDTPYGKYNEIGSLIGSSF